MKQKRTSLISIKSITTRHENGKNFCDEKRQLCFDRKKLILFKFLSRLSSEQVEFLEKM